MHLAYGRTVGERCGDCAFLVSHGKASTYFKCRAYGVSRGAATDWRAKWAACGRFNPRRSEKAEALHLAIPEPPPEFVEERIPQNPDRKNLRDEAARWIRQNAEAYEELLRWAKQRQAAGLALNIAILAEQLRLYGRRTRLEGDPFALNNNHRAYIARNLVSDAPELLECFRFRRTRY